MRIPFHYQGSVRDYLIQLKFDEAPHYAHTLTHYGMPAFEDLTSRPEALIPVPLHRSRLLMRGYNQAEGIARMWSRALEIPIDRHALTRTRTTLNQSGLSASRRVENVRGAFEYSPKRTYRHVAVVDDIVTTGSTVDEITRLLHRNGVEFVEKATGAPVLKGALGWVDCRVHSEFEAGDHSIVVGEVQACDAEEGDPLLYFGGGYRSIAP